MAQASWIVPIPGTTQMPHMLENAGAAAVRFTAAELEELNRAVRAIRIRGERMSTTVQAWSDVEAPPRRT
jgi:aryl-alcohol dehydrogenase-like predicted oxidoreductase